MQSPVQDFPLWRLHTAVSSTTLHFGHCTQQSPVHCREDQWNEMKLSTVLESGRHHSFSVWQFEQSTGQVHRKVAKVKGDEWIYFWEWNPSLAPQCVASYICTISVSAVKCVECVEVAAIWPNLICICICIFICICICIFICIFICICIWSAQKSGLCGGGSNLPKSSRRLPRKLAKVVGFVFVL